MKTIVSLLIVCGLSLQLRAQVSFVLSSSPSVPTPEYIAVADMNGDGRMDLITVSSQSVFSVLTNNGTGGFGLSASPAAAPNANTVLVVDINGDGKLDLITADYYDSTFMVLTNDGQGGFVLSSTPATGMYPIGITAADVNGDGQLELISANSAEEDNTVSVLTNNGSGGYVTAGKYPVGDNPWCVVAADVNGDGKLDLITANYGGNSISVLTNDGSGGFATAGTYPAGPNPRNIVAVDVNGDGALDLVCANYNGGTISVLTNNGSGLFGASADYPVGSNPNFIASGDVNGDGLVDLVVANYGSSTLTVLTNAGSGQFVTAGTFAVGASPRAVVMVDVNGDGRLDLCTANEGDGSITILTNATAFPAPSVPVITAQPAGQTNVLGGTAVFSVGAMVTNGWGQLAYQWRLAGTNLPAATNRTLTLSNLALNQAGSYAVVVSDSAGSVTSSPALLVVRLEVVEVNGQIVAGSATALSPATVSLLGGYPGGYLFYTLDGSAPSTSSDLYYGPFFLTNSATIRVLCVSADFSQSTEGVPVTVQIVPAYSLQTTVTGAGSLSTNPPGGLYGSNSVVVLTATAGTNWSFAGWAGDATGNQNPLSVTMNGPRNVQARFVQTAFPLSLTTPGGGGVAADGLVNPVGVYYPAGSVVGINATASNGWSFLGWQGSVNAVKNPMKIVINQTNTIQGTFGTLVTTSSVGGSIGLSQPNPLPYGTFLTLSAIPDAGNYFVSWMGSASGATSPVALAITNAGPFFGGLFAPLPAGKHTLTVVVNGAGMVTNTPAASFYSLGDVVTLTANSLGASFLGWSQDASGTNNPLSIQITSNLVIQANFGGAPAVSISPLTSIVLAGSNTVLSANALGLPPLTFQWQNGQGIIPGATNPAFSILNARPADAGSYSVVVSNSLGSAISGLASVTVIGSPVITNQPAAQITVTAGHPASLVVGALGWPALAYQWQCNGTNLIGTTNAALLLPHVYPGDSGAYAVVITNVYGSVTSNPSGLTVLPLGIISPTRLAGGQFRFSFDTAQDMQYQIEYSTNLMDWNPWLNAGGSGQPMTLTDPNTAGSPQRYYRIALLPQ